MGEIQIEHAGIKGMKWGVRRYQNKDGTLTPAGKKRYSDKAEDYTTKQRIRDRKLYGKTAEKRINKRMLKGESIQSARHDEVVRKERIDSGKAIAKRVAKGALVVGGAVAVTKMLQNSGIGKSVASDVMAEEIVGVGRHVINAMFK